MIRVAATLVGVGIGFLIITIDKAVGTYPAIAGTSLVLSLLMLSRIRDCSK
jgi:hypothetical protein